MKNYLTLVLALSVVSAPAFASRARLESLGEGKNGSYYIDDSRNMFLNPAQIVHYKKKLFLELGAEPTGADNFNASRGQGGFTNTLGDFTYGVYLNQTSEKTLKTIALQNSLPGSATFINPDSTLELFFAGEGSLNWGLSAFWAGNNTKAENVVEKSMNQLGVRFGVDAGSLSVFGTVGVITKAENKDADSAANNSQLNGKIGVDAAAVYKMDGMTTWAKYNNTGADYKVLGTVANEIRMTSYGVGAGWKKDMTKSTNMFVRTGVDYSTASAIGKKATAYNVPLAVGAEAQAMSWLAIRGSIAQSLYGAQFGNNPSTLAANFRSSLGGTTTVSAGLGLTFGDVQIDGLVATNGAANPANDIAGFGTGPQSSSTFGFGDAMLSRVAMTYNF